MTLSRLAPLAGGASRRLGARVRADRHVTRSPTPIPRSCPRGPRTTAPGVTVVPAGTRP